MISSYSERASFPACDREVKGEMEMEIRTSDKHMSSITLLAIACSTMFEIIWLHTSPRPMRVGSLLHDLL